MEEYNRLKQFTFNGMLAEDTLFEMQKNGVCVKEGIVQQPVTRICETDFSPILWQQATEMSSVYVVLCQDLVQVKMRNFSHFNPPEAQPQCVFFHTIVRIHLVTYSCNGYEFVSYCRKLPDIQKSTGMLAYNHGF